MEGSDLDTNRVPDPEMRESPPTPRGLQTRRARHSIGGRHPSVVRRLLVSNVFWGLVLALLLWTTSTKNLVVANSVGASWRAAVTMAAHSHLAFGSRVVFTFGPLGFLVSPELFYGSTSVLAFLFALAFATALYSAVVWSLRRNAPLPLALVVAYLAGSVSFLSARYFGTNVAVEDVLVLVLIVGVSVLSLGRDDHVPTWIWISLGAVLGIFSLVKVSLGVAIVVTEVITVAFLPTDRRRAAGAIALGAVPLFCLGWFGTGNGFGNLIAFGRSSVDIIGGYGPAMALEEPARRYTYWWVVVAVVLVGAFAVAHCRRLPTRSQIGIGLVMVVTVWFLFKEGFVRHDSHDLVFFVAAPLLLAAFSLPWRFQAGLVVGMVGLAIVATGVGGSIPPRVNTPVTAVRNFVDQATTLASTHRRAHVMARSRRSLSGALAPTSAMVNLMQGNTAAVSPWMDTFLWADPGIHFDPFPVLQDYSAFTPSLDHLDTTFLGSTKAPRYILRQPLAEIDGRNPAFDPPAMQVAIECRYHEVAADTVWQLLERGPDRCGTSRLLGTVTTGTGHWVTVPSAPAGDDVVASFQLPGGLFSRLESLLYKPPNVFLAANNGQETWRFVAATGPEFHVLRASANLGYSPAFVPVPARNVRVSINGEGPSASGITIAFYAIPVAAP